VREIYTGNLYLSKIVENSMKNSSIPNSHLNNRDNNVLKMISRDFSNPRMPLALPLVKKIMGFMRAFAMFALIFFMIATSRILSFQRTF
jgi:hypothetical protein